MQQLALADASVLARLMAKVNQNGPVPANRPDLGPCWLWTGSRDSRNGGRYGYFSVRGRIVLPHRLAYELLVGSIPDGLQLDHLCGNKGCVNTAHLEPVTPQINTLRSPRCMVTHCPKGHPYDEENTYIRPDGSHRDCRECKRQYNRNYQRKDRLSVPRPTALPKGSPDPQLPVGAGGGTKEQHGREARSGRPVMAARGPTTDGRESAFSAPIACEPDRRGRMSDRRTPASILHSSPLPSSIPPASDGEKSPPVSS